MAIDWNIYEWEIVFRGTSLGRHSNQDRIPYLKTYLAENNIEYTDILPGEVEYKLVKKELKHSGTGII